MRKFLALLAASLYLACRTGAEVLPAEKLLPDDTIFMATVPDFNQIRDIGHNSPLGRLWNDPAMRDFKEKFLGKFKSDYLTPLEHDLGIHFEDYTNLPQGQLTFAVTQNDWQTRTGSPGILFLLDTKTRSGQLKTNLADLKKKWVDAGKTVKTEKIRDVEFSVIVLSSNDIPKSLAKASPPTPASPDSPDTADNPDKHEPKTQIYIGQSESLLILGNSPKVIEKLLARMSGASVKVVSDLDAYAADAGMFRNAPFFGWVNLKSIVDAYNHPGEDSAGAGPANPLAFKPEKVMAALGLNGLKSLAFNYLSTTEGAQFNVQITVPESSRTGLFKIFAGEAKDYNPPPFVPADAVKFQRWRLDGQKTYATLRKMISDISPAGIGGLDLMLNSAQEAAKEKDPSFDINKALFGNLGDDIITYSKNSKGATAAELNSPPSIILIGSPNPNQLADALKNLLVLYNGASVPPTEREFLGHKIYSIPQPGAPPPDSPTAAPRALNYACSGGYMAITSDAALLEEYLRSSETPPKPLRDMPGLSEAAQKVAGGGTSLFGFSNESESTRVLFDSLKKDPGGPNPMAALTPLAIAVGMGDVKISDWLDITLLPAFDKVSKYFYFSVYAASANADGLSFKVFAPVPPQLKK